MLTTVYWFCFIVGGFFVALAALGGLELGAEGEGLDFDAEAGGLDFELEAEGVDLEAAVETDLELVDLGDGSQKRSQRRRRGRRRHQLSVVGMLTTFKFWTFSSCFFGLTGLALSALTNLNAAMIAVLAVAIGLCCGSAIALILQSLRHNQTNSLVRSEDLVGMTGTVELPFDAHSPGKVRLKVKGSTIDFLAFTDDPIPLTQGKQVVIMGTQQNRLWVVSAETFNKQ
jgi:membrane protein implicated in regulation of membrane protease activity